MQGEGRGCMEGEVFVSGGDALRVVSLDKAQEYKRVPLERSGALCAAGESVFCACGDAVWRLDRKSLTPQALFGAGPGVRELLPSPDGLRLYALCSEADSILMLDGRSGEPLLLQYAGVNPRQMALDGDVLAIAGGESGDVLLLCAQSLRMLCRLSMPGPVYSAVLCAGNVHALCLTPTLSSVLVTQERNGQRKALALSGMPGRLLVQSRGIWAATEGDLYLISQDGRCILEQLSIPGRASWLCGMQSGMLMLDAYSDSLFSLEPSGCRMLLRGAAAAAYAGA